MSALTGRLGINAEHDTGVVDPSELTLHGRCAACATREPGGRLQTTCNLIVFLDIAKFDCCGGGEQCTGKRAGTVPRKTVSRGCLGSSKGTRIGGDGAEGDRRGILHSLRARRLISQPASSNVALGFSDRCEVR
jgi:hypothetical protein